MLLGVISNDLHGNQVAVSILVKKFGYSLPVPGIPNGPDTVIPNVDCKVVTDAILAKGGKLISVINAGYHLFDEKLPACGKVLHVVTYEGVADRDTLESSLFDAMMHLLGGDDLVEE